MTTILVLGGTGMLGSMVADVLSRQPEYTVTATARRPDLAAEMSSRLPQVRWVSFDAGTDFEQALEAAGRHNWIINAIGITKPLIRDDNPAEIETAVRVNSLLPHAIGRHARAVGSRVLQIATDCVYSGARGAYVETDPHDALDVYGKTKSLGECYHPAVHHLRCSIIGPEPKDYKFLLEWFRRQPPAAQLRGFTNHQWNGVTTLQFARICSGVIAGDLELPHLQHVVPSGSISKARMLRDFAAAWKRTDLRIADVEAPAIVDRTLATINPGLNASLWRAAGYTEPPGVPDMIAELAACEYRPAGISGAVTQR